MTAVHYKVRKGDEVVILAGRDKGKRAEIIKMLPQKGKVIVSGINVAKRHTKPQQGQAGGIIDKEMPIDVSNVALADPKDGKPTRVGYKTLEDGRKVRFAKKSGEMIDQ